jgi:DNA (cytosine-5)-methyltransferase 1
VGRTGKPLLNPVFVEWMMGLPKGWVTGHGLSPAQCLKMLGNGVVPQQANYAITQLLARIS